MEPETWHIEVPDGDGEMKVMTALMKVLEMGRLSPAAQRRTLAWFNDRVAPAPEGDRDA